MKQIQIDFEETVYAQIEQMCAAFNSTPNEYFSQEMRGAFMRLKQRYEQVADMKRPSVATIRVVEKEVK